MYQTSALIKAASALVMSAQGQLCDSQFFLRLTPGKRLAPVTLVPDQAFQSCALRSLGSLLSHPQRTEHRILPVSGEREEEIFSWRWRYFMPGDCMWKVVDGGVSLNFTLKLGFGSILGPLSP